MLSFAVSVRVTHKPPRADSEVWQPLGPSCIRYVSALFLVRFEHQFSYVSATKSPKVKPYSDR
jgi:hypothetical protein